MQDRLSKIIKKSFLEIEKKNYKTAAEMLYPELVNYPDNIELIIQIARCYYCMGEKEQASEYYEKAFDINNYSTTILEPLIELKIEQEKYNEAEKYANCYLKCDDKTYAIQKYLETMEKLEKTDIVEDYANNNDINNLNSTCIAIVADCIMENGIKIKDNEEEKSNKLQRAYDFAKKALTLDKNNIKASIVIAWYYVQKKDYQKAKDVIKNAPQYDKNWKALNSLGFIEYNCKNYENASGYFAKAIELEPENQILYYNLTEAYMNQGWLKEAEITAKNGIMLDEKNVNIKLALANTYYMGNAFDKTILILSNIEEIEPDNEEMNLLYAFSYAHQNDFKKAEIYAKKIENKFDSGYFDESFARIHYYLGQKDKANEKINLALEKEPDNISFLDTKAEFLLRENNDEAALKIYDRIIEINPEYVDAYYQKSQIYLSNNDNEKALLNLQKAVEMDGNNALYQDCLAHLYFYDLKDYDKAIETMKFAISLTPDSTMKYYFVGRVYLEKGDLESAIAYFKEILSVNPHDFDAIYNVAMILGSKEKINEAYDFYRKAFHLNPYDYDFIRDYSDFVTEKVHAFNGIKILLNFSKYTKNKNLSIESRNRAKRVIRENKKNLSIKEKFLLLFK